jgi:ABC-type branched-subunit amino acid transport system permease subunit
VARTKLAVFVLSAALAGLGGALLGGVNFIAEPNDYQMLLSLSMLLLVTVWGVRSVSGVLLAGVAFYLIPYFVNNNYSWLYLLTGLGAIGISRNPEGVIGDLIARVRPGSSSRGARTRPLAPSPAASPVSQTAPVVADADV